MGCFQQRFYLSRVTHRLFTAVLLSVTALASWNAVHIASAAQVRLYEVQCAKVRVSGVTTVAAPFVRVRVATADNLMNTLAQKEQPVFPAIGRAFSITVSFPQQPEGKRLMVTVGEWDGLSYVQPAVMYGQDCASSRSITPTATIGNSYLSSYVSKEARFAVQYPTQWTVNVQDKVIYFQSNKQIGSGPDPIQYMVYVVEQVNSDGLPFAQLAKQELPDDLQATFTYTKRTIGALTAYSTESLLSRSGSLTVFLTHDGSRYIRFSLTPYDSKKPFTQQNDYKSIFEMMLTSVIMD